MESKSGTEDLAMTLVEQALRRPDGERELFLRNACGGNSTLFDDAWNYVQWEARMQGFLAESVPAVAEKPPFEAGQVLISRFQVIREVARGGMGIVWEAIDRKLDRRVALKCAKRGHGKQLPPEVRNAREISHPNVCKIYDIHTASTAEGEIDFIAMEFLEGITLAERLNAGPIPEREARVIAQQLCAGLAEAHRNLLVHGDLKTNNVILTGNPGTAVRAVITDFGLARKCDTSAGILGGTPTYMAPELWKGQPPSQASDIYALGVMLWELHTGKSPAELGTLSSKVPGENEHSGWKPPERRGKWKRIIARCLQTDPSARFASATEVARAFGPSRTLTWTIAAAGIVVLVAASGLVTYMRATAPKEHVRLAVAPLGPTPDQHSPGGMLLKEEATQLSHVRGTSRTGFQFAGTTAAATHTLGTSIEQHGDSYSVHAVLRDLRSGTDAGDWTEQYRADQLRYAPVALAGLVTETLHLRPGAADRPAINESAKKFYQSGLNLMRRDQTLNEALDQFQRAVNTDPDSALPLAGLAEAEFLKYSLTFDRSWLNRSTESLRHAQLRNPDIAQIHQVNGLLKKEAGHDEEAIGEYVRVLELDPANGDAYRRLGVTYEHNGQKEEALASLKKAVEKDPRNYRNYRELGEFYGDRANYGMAAAQFRRALELAPENPDILYRLGVAYKDAGQFPASEKALRESLRVKETARCLHTLGVLLMSESKDAEAVVNFSRALQLDQSRVITWLNLGTADRRLGRTADSEHAYRRALELAEKELPQNPKDGLVRGRLGFVCARLNQIQRANSEIAQALGFGPKNANVLWMVVVTYEALGRRDDTLNVLAKSPPGLLESLDRWPDLADLQHDPRFKRMLASHER